MGIFSFVRVNPRLVVSALIKSHSKRSSENLALGVPACRSTARATVGKLVALKKHGGTSFLLGQRSLECGL